MPKMFVTEVYQAPLKFDLNDLKTEFFQIEKSDLQGQKWCRKNYPNGYTSYGSLDRLYLLSSSFDLLRRKLDVHVQKYVKNLSYDLPAKSLKMNSMWVNIMRNGAYHTAHIHPHSVISGTFYVDVPAQASSIRFEDPRLGFMMNSPLIKTDATLEKQRFVSLKPKAGEVILFESWLKHEVPRNHSRKPRLSVSFNYGW